MPRRLLVALLAAVVGVGTTAVVMARLVPAVDEEPSVLSEPTQNVTAVPLMKPGARDGRVRLIFSPVQAVAEAQVGVRVATYLQEPTATLRLVARADDGRSLADCSFPPDRYADNALVLCPVDEPTAIAFLDVEARDARSPVAVYAREDPDGLRAGSLFAMPYPSSLTDRIGLVVDRVTVGRPLPDLSLFVLLFGSICGTALLVPVLLDSARTSRSLPRGDPGRRDGDGP